MTPDASQGLAPPAPLDGGGADAPAAGEGPPPTPTAEADVRPHSIHPAHVAHPSGRGLVRAFWVAAGTIALLLGIVGVIVPGWPTTIFVILAAAAYARSSQRLYDRLTRNRLIGRHARAFRETGLMPLRAKL